jgi:hypothetical protein
MPEETETGKQIKGALGGIAEGLAAAFAPKKAPPKRERPTIKMNPNKRERSGALRRGDKRHEPLPPGRPNDSKKVRGVEPEERERTPTETGQNLANLMGSIVKESTTGKRYAEEGTHGQFDSEDHDGRPNDPKVLKELHERDQAVQRLDQKDPWRERGPWRIVRNKNQTFDYVEEGTEGQPGLTHEAADRLMPQAERLKWAAAGLPNPPQRSGTNPVGYVEEGTEGQPGVVEVTGATAHEYSHQVQDIRDASPGGFIEGVAKLPDAPSMRSKGSRVHFDAGHT